MDAIKIAIYTFLFTSIYILLNMSLFSKQKLQSRIIFIKQLFYYKIFNISVILNKLLCIDVYPQVNA